MFHSRQHNRWLHNCAVCAHSSPTATVRAFTRTHGPTIYGSVEVFFQPLTRTSGCDASETSHTLVGLAAAGVSPRNCTADSAACFASEAWPRSNSWFARPPYAWPSAGSNCARRLTPHTIQLSEG